MKEKEKYGIGTKHRTNEGYEIEIVEKLENKRRRVRFKNGYEVYITCQSINTGNIKNLYHPSILGAGYLGVGRYKVEINGKLTPEYKVWRSMLQRCYDKKTQEKYPTYKGVTVCEEWKNFQNFAQWYNNNNNYHKIEGLKFELDKDLLQENIDNKIYSSETCIFLPHNVNSFLANKSSNNTSGYTGVSWDKRDKKWRSQISLFEEGKIKHIGYFNTPEQASEAYEYARAEQSKKAKDYLRSLNYLPEHIIQLIK